MKKTIKTIISNLISIIWVSLFIVLMLSDMGDFEKIIYFGGLLFGSLPICALLSAINK